MEKESNNSLEAIQELINIVAKLRSPSKGCPWDREQTHLSLIPYLIEETYEVVDAIRNKDASNLKEELGDLLLQIILHAQIAQENNCFCLEDLAKDVNKKLIRRHPHVFGNKEIKTIDAAKKSWEKIKMAEKTGSKYKKNLSSQLKDKVRSQPAITGAMTISKTVANIGFDWKTFEDLWEKVTEEVDELKEALDKKDFQNAEEELGDVMFTLINIGRWFKLKPEEGLAGTNKRFLERFAYIEETLGGNFKKCSADELTNLWELAKKENKQGKVL